METKHKEFKPFDRVLVKDSYKKWYCSFYSHFRDNCENDEPCHYTTSTFGYSDEDILPYEGNEHLVGTTDTPDEEVKLEEGECCVFADRPEYFLDGGCGLGKFSQTSEESFVDSYGILWKYAIRFSDFNPNDMKETKKHILCVKNGKVVRYKG